MSEEQLWCDLAFVMMSDEKWHASRVESHATSAGIPDVDYCYYGDGHIELKFGDSITKKMPAIRDTQVRWMTKRAAVGGKVLMLTKLMDGPKEIYLFHKGSFILNLNMNRDYVYWFNNRINDAYWGLPEAETKLLLKGERQ
ncbi:MAG: hypothetical protein OEQ39_00035 [Gammaproteobacteria bacterium]|nr:hypothetical protein [Gammaproteobacteria bacterium]